MKLSKDTALINEHINKVEKQIKEQSKETNLSFWEGYISGLKFALKTLEEINLHNNEKVEKWTHCKN